MKITFISADFMLDSDNYMNMLFSPHSKPGDRYCYYLCKNSLQASLNTKPVRGMVALGN